MNNIDLIEEELWDHYSRLPNPLWYQYKKNLGDEEGVPIPISEQVKRMFKTPEDRL